MNTIPTAQNVLPAAEYVSMELLLWTAFGTAVLLTVIFGAILVYHWREYEMNPRRQRIFIWLYFSVALILLLTVGGGIVVYLYV
jgi:hypothetical protein